MRGPVLATMVFLTASAAVFADDSNKCDTGKATPAYWMNSLEDQIGVNVHLGFYNTPYGNYENLVRPLLKDLGVRHLRDVAITDLAASKEYYRRLADLVERGFDFSLVVFDDTVPTYSADITALPQIAKKLGKGLLYLEGTNEPNLKGFAEWGEITKRSQQALFSTKTHDTRFNAISVLGPTPWGKDASLLGDLSSVVDKGNWHTYSGGQFPEFTGKASISDYLAQSAHLFPGKAMVITEDGYHSALDVPVHGHRPTPENVITKYLPRLLLRNIALGIERTYLYELIDTRIRGSTDPESNFGLARADGTKKPAYYAIKNLLGIFNERKLTLAAGAAPRMGFGISPCLEAMKVMQFRGREATTFLVMWLGLPSWDPDSRTRTSVVPRDIHISVPTNYTFRSALHLEEDGSFRNVGLNVVEGQPATIAIDDALTIVSYQEKSSDN